MPLAGRPCQAVDGEWEIRTSKILPYRERKAIEERAAMSAKVAARSQSMRAAQKVDPPTASLLRLVAHRAVSIVVLLWCFVRGPGPARKTDWFTVRSLSISRH